MTIFKHLRWALLWALLILVLCMLPGRDLPSFWWTEILSIDKLVHAGVFFVLVLLIARALRAHRGDLDLHSRTMRWWLVACVAYGGALELMQGLLLTDRYADVIDFLANALGCGLAWWWLRRKERLAGA